MAAQVTAGRVDRRQAILDAALATFARDGFVATSMDDVAEAAGVAKPTVYNHFGDKTALFLAALAHGSATANERVLTTIADMSATPDDLRAELERLGFALVGCLSGGAASAMRLQLMEATRFPDEIAAVRDGNRRRTIDALAGKLAQLAATGRLRISDPLRASRQFMALVTDEPLVASGFGAAGVAPAVIEASVTEGVDTFLAAFSSGGAGLSR
jgi:AcrR family transcriptional regulator